MELPKGVIRIKNGDLPNTWTNCGTKNCVYNTGGLCDEFATNKGNKSNRSLLARLEALTPNVI